jgi:hypothetical protein
MRTLMAFRACISAGQWTADFGIKSALFLTALGVLKNSSSICIITIPLTFIQLWYLPTECIRVFRMVLTINSDCFHKQH